MNEAPPLIAKLTEHSRLKHYPKGQIIIYQGDKPHEAIILANGYIKLYDIDKQGNEKILHVISPWAIAPFSFFSGPAENVRWF